MSVSIKGLNPDFARKLESLQKQIQQAGIDMQLSAALRPPAEQARLWRQSRSPAEIRAGIAHLKSAGAYYLSDLLENATAKPGPQVTRSLPGLSWHQWGEAADLFWLVDGKAEWSATRMVAGRNGYVELARMAATVGLTAGGTWTSFKDWPHVQKRAAPSPLQAGLSLKAISDEMQNRFG